jgi:hypothetical protein
VNSRRRWPNWGMLWIDPVGACRSEAILVRNISLKRGRIADAHSGVLFSAGAGRRGSVAAPSPRAPPTLLIAVLLPLLLLDINCKRGHF